MSDRQRPQTYDGTVKQSSSTASEQEQEEEISETQTREELSCDECGGDIIEDPGTNEEMCEDCGLIFDDTNIDRGPDWRAYSQSERNERSRGGPARTELRHDRGLSTTIDWKDKDGYGNQLSASKRSQMKRLRTWNKRSKHRGGGERGVSYANGEILRMGSALGVPKSIQETAASLYRQAYDNGLVPGRSIEGVASAALYIALRVHNAPRSLDEITQVSRVERRPISRTQRYLCRELGIALEPTDPSKYLPRFADEIDVGQRIVRTAEELLEVVPGHEKSGRDPTVLASAALYSATILEGQRVTQREISNAGDVTTVSIRNNYQIFMEHSDEVETSEDCVDDARSISYPTQPEEQESSLGSEEGSKTQSIEKGDKEKKIKESIAGGSDGQGSNGEKPAEHPDSPTRNQSNSPDDATPASTNPSEKEDRAMSNQSKTTEMARGDSKTKQSETPIEPEESEPEPNEDVTVEHNEDPIEPSEGPDLETDDSEATDTRSEPTPSNEETESEDESEFECDECDFTSESKRGLSIHEAVHKDGSRSGQSSDSRDIETEFPDEQYNFECHECDRVFGSYRGTTIHIGRGHNSNSSPKNREFHAVDPEEYPVTKTESATRQEARDKFPDDEFNFECHECDQVFGTYQGTAIHTGHAHDVEPEGRESHAVDPDEYPVTVTDPQTKREKEREEYPDEEYNFECHECERVFDTYRGAAIHTGRGHESSPEGRESHAVNQDEYPVTKTDLESQREARNKFPNDEYNFQCFECDDVFDTYTGVATHSSRGHGISVEQRGEHAVDPDEYPITPRETNTSISESGAKYDVESDFADTVEEFFTELEESEVHPAIARLAESLLLAGGRNAETSTYRSSNTAIAAALYAASEIIGQTVGERLTQSDVASVTGTTTLPISQHYEAYLTVLIETGVGLDRNASK